MSNYDIDFEIINAIKDTHTFNAIFEKVHGSKETFSKHLTQLVKAGVIEKRIKGNKPQFSINYTKSHDITKTFDDHIEKRISLMTKKHKKYSNKKLLQQFVKETVIDLKFYSVFHLDTLLPLFQTDLTLNSHKLEKLSKLIKTRIDILQKRDPKLLLVFQKSIENQLTKSLTN